MFFHAGANRANLYALAARNTSGLRQRHAEFRLNDRFETAVNQTQGGSADDFVTGADAQTAKHALVGVALDERMLVDLAAVVNFAF